MEKIEITTRGLSPLEEQIAELALSVREIGEKLPSNLARKFVNEVRATASKSSRYYIDISGRKNYALEDVLSFVRDLPENTLFDYMDVARKFRHHPTSMQSLLWKLYKTDEEVDLVKIDGKFLKPANVSVKINFNFRSKYSQKGLLTAKLSYAFCRQNDNPNERLIQLSKMNSKRAKAIIKRVNERLKRNDYGNKPDEFNPYIAQEIIELAEKDTSEKIKSKILEKGYCEFEYYNHEFDSNYLNEPKIKVTLGNKSNIYEVKIIEPSNPQSYGSDIVLRASEIAKEHFDNLKLISPVLVNKEVNSRIKYHPQLIREARRKECFLDSK